ncbi:MAG: DUF3631 domain-containing protein, partial [Acidobacteria bacterium]|nr:DUF3631 domain-containing protein [Acidobacteriota bacterium]
MSLESEIVSETADSASAAHDSGSSEAAGDGFEDEAAADSSSSEDETTFKRLAELSEVEYERVRKAEAENLGIRVNVLDRIVGSLRPAPPTEEDARGGQPITLVKPEPWPEPVNGAELIRDITNAIRRYVRLADAAAVAVALWILHAHIFEAFLISPRLAILSPMMRCGKTTLLRVVTALAPKPLAAANITSAALFRTIEACRPTLLLDEADTFLAGNEEMRGVINAGHSRDGQVIRVVGDNFEPRGFSTWSPMVIAAIGQLPGTIQDRSLVISLRRRLPGEPIERFRSGRTPELDELACKAARWAADHAEALQQADPDAPTNLNDRACDNWRPLLGIADCAGGPWPSAARAIAIELSQSEGSDDDDDWGIMLLVDIRSIFEEAKAAEAKAGWLSSADLVARLVALSGRPWSEANRGRPITSAWLARKLRPFKIS